MTTNREFGEKLLKEAEWIFEKDLKNALEEENHNIAVRRAQEVVELTLKGCLRILGIDYPKYMMPGVFLLQKPVKSSPLKEARSKR